MRMSSASEEDIKSGKTADVYFGKTVGILSSGFPDRQVIMDVTFSGSEFPFILLSGLNDTLSMLEGKNVDVFAIPEGTLIPNRDIKGIPLPVLSISGRYREFSVMETALLGSLSQASGISTKSCMIRAAAGDLPYISFGIRRMHPAISPMIDRSAFIGGADGVSGLMGAELIGRDAVGTMPHALSLLLGDEEAWKMCAGITNGKKTLLIDTFDDEKFAALKAARLIKDLDYVRLDTPSSRRGNFGNIVREVRWELDLRGYKNVKIMVSGGLDVESVMDLRKAGAEAFGVGTSVASAKPVDFALDIVEIEGNPIAKRGKYSGRKKVLRCQDCRKVSVVPIDAKDENCSCGGEMENLLKPVMKKGKMVGRYPSPSEIRERSMDEMKKGSALLSLVIENGD